MIANRLYDRIFRVISRIPRGRVATYGQIAKLAGIPRGARQVGYALRRGSGVRVPWHRVLNAQGEVSGRGDPACEELQRRLLEREAIVFDASGRVSLARFGWNGRASSPATRPRRGKKHRRPKLGANPGMDHHRIRK